MATLIEEVLATWRDAERVLATLPELDADHETVARAVLELRALYSELTAASAQSRMRLRTTRASVARTRVLLERTRGRLRGRPSRGDGPGPQGIG